MKKVKQSGFPKSGKVAARGAAEPSELTPGLRVRPLMAALLRHYGRQNWWPGRSRFEVVAGALLVQNTAWGNAEKALRNLRRAGVLSPAGIRRTSLARLEELVRPAGTFRQKARRLQTFVAYLTASHGGSLSRMFATGTAQLRTELLALNGIGDETADVILLYAGGHESFVVDAYARRILERHGVQPGRYAEVQELFRAAMDGLEGRTLHGRRPRHKESGMSQRREAWPARTKLFMEAHAVLVRVGHEHCRRTPDCGHCPLRDFLPSGRAHTETEHRSANSV